MRPRALVAGALALAAIRAEAAPDPVARLDRALRRTRNVQASFVQTRKSPLMAGEERTTGTLWVRKPGDARVEYRGPSPLIIWKRGDSTWVYVPALAQVVVSESGAAGVPVSWVLGTSLAEVRREADVRASGTEVEIRPHADAGLPWSSVRIGFGPGDFPNRYVFVDAAGEEVRLDLRQVRTNRGVPADRFRPRFPPGTDVVSTGR
jgi:outer membrane lipoprotein-sorting protein